MAKQATEAAPAAEPVVETQTVNDQAGQPERFPLRAPDKAEPPQAEAEDDDDFRGDEGEGYDEAEDEGEEGDEQPRDESGRFKSKGQTLRDRLAAEARERIAERQRADRLEAMLAQQQQLLAKQLGGEPEQPQAPRQGPPDPNDYPAGQFDPAFIQASTQYQINAALEAKEREMAHRQTQAYLISQEQQYAATVPDYLEAKQTLLSDPVIANHPGIGQAIVSSQRPAELIYALGKNPDVASNIARMNPIQAAMYLGKVEAILEAQAANQGQQPAAPAKPATAPIKPIGGHRPSGTPDIGNAKSYAEFVKIREQQEKAKMQR